MATIDYADLTIPTPAAYDPENPTKQQENLAYVQLQIYALKQAAGFQETESAGTDPALLDAIRALAFQDTAIELGDVTIRFMRNTLLIADV